ncbi:extensin-like [Oncorhynchus kisutch]|uniref:extensin-like n=1 Tax=Oncorhynchus kisutch TaxID=8019 RepID=UPI0012DF12F5|nr:extensin-like [Oncorhynchus kisutch]
MEHWQPQPCNRSHTKTSCAPEWHIGSPNPATGATPRPPVPQNGALAAPTLQQEPHQDLLCPRMAHWQPQPCNKSHTKTSCGPEWRIGSPNPATRATPRSPVPQNGALAAPTLQQEPHQDLLCPRMAHWQPQPCNRSHTKTSCAPEWHIGSPNPATGVTPRPPVPQNGALAAPTLQQEPNQDLLCPRMAHWQQQPCNRSHTKTSCAPEWRIGSPNPATGATPRPPVPQNGALAAPTLQQEPHQDLLCPRMAHWQPQPCNRSHTKTSCAPEWRIGSPNPATGATPRPPVPQNGALAAPTLQQEPHQDLLCPRMAHWQPQPCNRSHTKTSCAPEWCIGSPNPATGATPRPPVPQNGALAAPTLQQEPHQDLLCPRMAHWQPQPCNRSHTKTSCAPEWRIGSPNPATGATPRPPVPQNGALAAPTLQQEPHQDLLCPRMAHWQPQPCNRSHTKTSCAPEWRIGSPNPATGATPRPPVPQNGALAAPTLQQEPHQDLLCPRMAHWQPQPCNRSHTKTSCAPEWHIGSPNPATGATPRPPVPQNGALAAPTLQQEPHQDLLCPRMAHWQPQPCNRSHTKTSCAPEWHIGSPNPATGATPRPPVPQNGALAAPTLQQEPHQDLLCPRMAHWQPQPCKRSHTKTSCAPEWRIGSPNPATGATPRPPVPQNGALAAPTLQQEPHQDLLCPRMAHWQPQPCNRSHTKTSCAPEWRIGSPNPATGATPRPPVPQNGTLAAPTLQQESHQDLLCPRMAHWQPQPCNKSHTKTSCAPEWRIGSPNPATGATPRPPVPQNGALAAPTLQQEPHQDLLCPRMAHWQPQPCNRSHTKTSCAPEWRIGSPNPATGATPRPPVPQNGTLAAPTLQQEPHQDLLCPRMAHWQPQPCNRSHTKTSCAPEWRIGSPNTATGATPRPPVPQNGTLAAPTLQQEPHQDLLCPRMAHWQPQPCNKSHTKTSCAQEWHIGSPNPATGATPRPPVPQNGALAAPTLQQEPHQNPRMAHWQPLRYPAAAPLFGGGSFIRLD